MTATHPHMLFLYGTLKTGNGNNYLLERHGGQFIAKGLTVEKFLLNDSFPFVFPPNDGKGAVAKQENANLGHVSGELWRVNDAGLRACDLLEGHPTSYTRTPVKVHYETEPGGPAVIEAGIYLMLSGFRGRLLQVPDAQGTLEWGRFNREEAADFQRDRDRRQHQRKR